MNFNEIDWADSSIEEINIKYDELVIEVFNDSLNKKIYVVCKNFAGITNLCLWDDIYISNAKLESATNEVFYKNILNAYRGRNGEFDNINPNRTLTAGLLKLSIELSNGVPCEIYCQNVEIQ